MMIRSRRAYDPLKRLLDIVAALVGLILLAPAMAATAALVAIRLGRPILFSQQRPGRDGRIFTLYKFRSMHDVDPQEGKTADAHRLTPFGKWLRSTSLDELPSLWNVLRGEMSMVGPRPLLVEYLSLYSPTQARRHEVRPGITGLAQAIGRNSLEWEEKFELDVRYVDQRSLGLDFWVIVATVRAVVLRKGITQEGEATTRAFGGANGD